MIIIITTYNTLYCGGGGGGGYCGCMASVLYFGSEGQQLKANGPAMHYGVMSPKG